MAVLGRAGVDLAPQPARARWAAAGADNVTPGGGEPTGNWYFIITLASFGSLAAVPLFHAASRV